MGAPLDAVFDVTSAPPGWANYTSIMATTTACNGCTTSAPVYDIVRSDGFLDTFGPIIAVGDAGDLALKAPIVGSAVTADAGGYWLVGADGGVFSFADAGFYGSLPADHVTPAEPIVGIAPTADGEGYWLVGADGGPSSTAPWGASPSMLQWWPWRQRPAVTATGWLPAMAVSSHLATPRLRDRQPATLSSSP
jgi:hypothetical protein